MHCCGLKRICIAAILSALYFVFSGTMRIPFIGHISLDLGYIVLTFTAVCFGGVTAMIVGAFGCALESLLLSPLGFSVSWFVMNLIVGLFVGLTTYRLEKPYRWIGVPVILIAVAVGTVAKTGIECWLYSIPFAVKAPKALTAFVVDSAVMIASLPAAYMTKARLIRKKEVKK